VSVFLVPAQWDYPECRAVNWVVVNVVVIDILYIIVIQSSLI